MPTSWHKMIAASKVENMFSASKKSSAMKPRRNSSNSPKLTSLRRRSRQCRDRWGYRSLRVVRTYPKVIIICITLIRSSFKMVTSLIPTLLSVKTSSCCRWMKIIDHRCLYLARKGLCKRFCQTMIKEGWDPREKSNQATKSLEARKQETKWRSILKSIHQNQVRFLWSHWRKRPKAKPEMMPWW